MSLVALERSRALVKAIGAPLTDLNDDAKSVTTEMYRRDYDELDEILRDYLSDKRPETDFVGLHNRWVVKMSKRWANFMVNPRFHR